MKNVNIRALTFVAALVTTITAGVVLVRQPAGGTPVASNVAATFSERVDLHGEPNSERQKAGLEIRMKRDGMSFTVPNCDMSELKSSFFVHVYPATAKGDVSTEFVGRDFEISKEPAKRITTQSGPQCVVERPFDVPNVKEVVVGQFTMPGGQCCRIMWSRTFIVEQ